MHTEITSKEKPELIVPYRTGREPEWPAQDWAYRSEPSRPKSPSSTSRSWTYGTVRTSPFSVTTHDLRQLHKIHIKFEASGIRNENQKRIRSYELFEENLARKSSNWKKMNGISEGNWNFTRWFFWCWCGSASSSSSRLYVCSSKKKLWAERFGAFYTLGFVAEGYI